MLILNNDKINIEFIKMIFEINITQNNKINDYINILLIIISFIFLVKFNLRIKTK